MGDILDYALNNGANDFYQAIAAATSVQDWNTVDKLISHGQLNFQSIVNAQLEGAAKAGNKELIDQLIDKGANNWVDALLAACEGHHLEIVKDMINRGATNFADGLVSALDDINIVKLILEYMPHVEYDDVEASISTGNPEIFALLYDRSLGDKSRFIYEIAREGELEILKLFLVKNSNPSNEKIDAAIRIASDNNNLNIVYYLLKYKQRIEAQRIAKAWLSNGFSGLSDELIHLFE